MKFLTISDINFPKDIGGKSKDQIDNYIGKRNNKLSNLINIIINKKIDVILMAGDIMGDVSSDYYAGVIHWLFEYFESNKIYCYFIAGNHDVDESYNDIIESIKDFKYVYEISGKIVNHKGINILGLSYFDTENITKLKSKISTSPSVDIVLCHSQNKRIPFLLDFKTRIVITGHFEFIFGSVENTILIAINMGYFSIIDITKKRTHINYYRIWPLMGFFEGYSKPYFCSINNNSIEFDNICNETYVHDLRLIKSIKNEYLKDSSLSKELINSYIKRKKLYKISKSTQLQYLGKILFDKINQIK